MISKISVLEGATPTLVSASKMRTAYTIQNLSDADIFVALEGSSDVTGAAGSKPGLKIAPGAIVDRWGTEAKWDERHHSIFAIHEGTGTKVLTIQEL